uniref:NADH-ubiquinone oxidoreductase chain 6 n=1 Tax=Batrachoseps nigriventris TaxID=458151 RepID=A0A0N9YQ27_9SALA|nr:NADH dehydrogenase subunit 6 [Batrachoseps nigriventris]ALI30682.1 NADH dehydrogenase subunit 6 [Batrachoseps nigriventris]
MIYMSFLALTGLVIGLVAVASNPSPYYAAFGLVVGAVCGCWILVDFGVSFLSIILLLIYLGGMMVVFAYSASLAAEPYPEAWGNWSVLAYIFMYILGVVVSFYFFGVWSGFEGLFSNMSVGFNNVISDSSGIGEMYVSGAVFLVVSGWALLLTLFVVLEITRGVSRGSLRAV